VAGQTGADSQADPAAEAAYDGIRASTTDVAAIAQTTGIKPENVQQVKDHTFMQAHLLDRFVRQGIAPQVRRFHASAGIAAAWERLAAGQGTAHDLQLLRHEGAEAWFMRRHGPSFDAAHTAAHARYPWKG
jgi:hypothetical protein